MTQDQGGFGGAGPQGNPGGWGAPPAAPHAPGQAPIQGPMGGPTPGMPDEKERMWAMIAHFSPWFLGFVGPLLLMFLDESVVGHPSPFVKHHAKQALLWSIVTLVVTMVTCGLGFVITFVHIFGGLAANKGEWYAYPMLGSFVDKS